MSEHTAGPWVVGKDIGAGIAICTRDKGLNSLIGLSCFGRARTKGERLANARLIAAAPELLEACKAMATNIAHWLDTGEPANAVESQELYEQMIGAIAKAKGIRACKTASAIE